MAVTIDLFVVTDKWIGFDEVARQIQSMGFELQIDDIEVVDDWMYTNFQSLSNQIEPSTLKEYINTGKIGVMHFTVNTIWHGGCHISKKKEGPFEWAYWLDTQNISYLEDEEITLQNKHFYEEVTRAVMQHANAGILLAGIGVELDIEYHNDPIATISLYSRIGRWIVPEVIQRDFEHYRKEEQGGFVIYTHE